MLDSAATSHKPLVIDLEGALIKTRVRDEVLLDTLRIDPLVALRLLAGVKVDIATTLVHAERWPVRQDVVDFARKHADDGGHVALATRGDPAIAAAIKARFPFITEVIAVEDGSRTSTVLERRFPQGFGYMAAGSPEDREVWRHGAECVLVGASATGGECRPVATLPQKSVGLSVLRKGLRLHQWAKNALIFVPLVLGGKAGDPTAWLAALAGFIALGCVASATYVLNDLWDLPSDRNHWSKHKRPLASGDLPLRRGVQLAALGLGAGFLIAALISPLAVASLAVYVAVTLGYSVALKRIPVLDVLVLAGLFTLRLGIGVVLADVVMSPWLLAFSMFTFMSLSLAKRHTEVTRLAQHDLKQMSGRGYLAGDGPFILGLGLAGAMGSILIMILYLIEDAFPQHFYNKPYMLWALPPLLFLFLGRIWLLCVRDRLEDDPVAFALKDSTSLAIGALGGLAFLAAIA